MKLLDEYSKIKEEIHNYFGYVEDWAIIPIKDMRKYFWDLGNNEVIYAKTENDFNTGDYYQDEIYTQRFLTKWVYEKEEYTMICVDTHTDGNKFLAIYDNSKRIKGLINEID